MIAPFPYFGGKRRVSDVVWRAFGDAQNYVEPFAGSLAVLPARSAFAQKWDAIYNKRGLGWAANPWVWVITFRRLENA